MMMKQNLLSLTMIVSLGLLQGCGGSGGSESGNGSSTSSEPSLPSQNEESPKGILDVINTIVSDVIGGSTHEAIGESTDTEPNVQNEPIISTLINQISLFNSGSTLTAADFGLESWNAKSIASANHILYIANDSSNASILRYDLKNKKALPPILAENITGLAQAWNRLYDLSIYKDRLYAASLSSNRVDVFDIASAEPQFIMSLGTGSWSGDQHNKAIVYALSVAANDQYVFTPDIQGRINVWKQTDVTTANHLKVLKHARLSLSECNSTYCDVRLEATSDLLYASFGNGKTYVYDVSSIPAGASDLQPIKQESAVANIFNLADNGQFYAARTSGRIDSFNLDSLKTAVSALPSALESFQNYKLLGDSTDYRLTKSADMVVANHQLFSLANGQVTILPMQKISQYQSNVRANPAQINLAAAIYQSRMLQDGESWETLTHYNLRNFHINRILSGTVDKNTLNLQSYSALPVNDLEIHAKLKDTSQWFVLAKLDQLAAFSQAKFNFSIADANSFPLVDGTGAVQFSGMSNLNQLPSDLLDIKIISKTDPHVQKLATIKPVWNIAFGKYAETADASWRRINPVYAREWVIMMTNFAYIISSPEFEHIWFNHKKVMGHDFFGNKGQVEGTGGVFTEAEYKKYYAGIMNRGLINLGVTSMGGGLGGGTVLGIDTWYFYSHYFNADIGVIGHEFGHHWGSHDSAWANSSYGLQSVNLQLHQYFQRKQQLPYLDPYLNKFHLAPPEQLYNGIAESMRTPRPVTNINRLEKYFQQNPL